MSEPDDGTIKPDKGEAWVGHNCGHCEEPIVAGETIITMMHYEPGRPYRRPMHQECFVRLTLGSVGHQQHLCRCYGGTMDDPPGMTKREAAKAAAAVSKRTITRSSPPDAPDCAMPIHVVYNSPKDYPGKIVVRCQWPIADGKIQASKYAKVYDSLDQVRTVMQSRGLFCIPRSSADDPGIVESWV
jgi:hypothetical protein